ncbi:hypothetical protein SEA_CHEWYVIII_85 [Rhodococcus phage ChewyVIII]|uniref:Uncharacterized protein n=1 Tax=Rhodococcus phage ChewyVIII TaxID=1887657 RepID=A0A1C9EIA0_9CAUD|nr:hypothetical protein QEH30_gp85 [Rhodococcus phage ChewyVIII]AON97506.1 hypothetical protein SEA_CHEWYVIII_85 [Rhodococcus phage ChewyVIII]
MPVLQLTEDQQDAVELLNEDLVAVALGNGWAEVGPSGCNDDYAFTVLEHAGLDGKLQLLVAVFDSEADSSPDKFVIGNKVISQSEMLALINTNHRVPPTDAAHTEEAVPPTAVPPTSTDAMPPTVPPTGESDAAHSEEVLDAAHQHKEKLEEYGEMPPTSEEAFWVGKTNLLETDYDPDTVSQETIDAGAARIAESIDGAPEDQPLPTKVTFMDIGFDLLWNKDESAAHATVSNPDRLGESHAALAIKLKHTLEDELMLDPREGDRWIAECDAVLKANADVKQAQKHPTPDKNHQPAYSENETHEAAADLAQDEDRLWSNLVSHLSDEEIIKAVLGKTVHWHNKHSRRDNSAKVTAKATNHPAQITSNLIDQDDYRTLSFLEEGGGFRSLAVCRITKITK